MRPDPRPERLRGVERSVAALRSRRGLLVLPSPSVSLSARVGVAARATNPSPAFRQALSA